MKKWFYLVFILFCCASCRDEQTKVPLPSSNGGNVLRVFFESKLNSMSRGVESLDDLLGSGDVLLLDYIESGYSALYGNYFAIPVKNRGSAEVESCLVYPVGDLHEGEHSLAGELGQPFLLDQVFFANLPEENRFLFSLRFLRWQNQGLPVSHGLVTNAEALNNKFIPFQSDSAFSFSFSNLAQGSGVSRGSEDFYRCTYRVEYLLRDLVYDNDDGITVVQVSNEGRRGVFIDALRGLAGYQEYRGGNVVRVVKYLELEVDLDNPTRVDRIIMDYMQWASAYFKTRYHVDQLDYRYTADVVHVEVGGGGSSGGGTGGGTTTPPAEVESPCRYGKKCSSRPCSCCTICEEPCRVNPCPYCQKKHCAQIHVDCDDMDLPSKRIAGDGYDIMSRTTHVSIDEPGFQDFLDRIRENPTIEYSTALNYKRSSSTHGLTTILSGTTDQVTMDVYNTSRAIMHSHPSGKLNPPSPGDFITMAKIASDSSKFPLFTSSYVYVNGDVYALQVVDRKKVAAFLKANPDCVDGTGNFVEGGVLSEKFNKVIKVYLPEIGEVNAFAFALSEVLRDYDTGIQLLRKRKNDAAFSVLKTKSVGQDQIILVICQ